jgi:guanylate kinase
VLTTVVVPVTAAATVLTTVVVPVTAAATRVTTVVVPVAAAATMVTTVVVPVAAAATMVTTVVVPDLHAFVPSGDGLSAAMVDCMATGRLFVVSAPSGTGKTTVVERLLQQVSDLVASRSYTSRAPRPGEYDGVDYSYVSRSEFEAMVARDEFLEWADVFGHLYGTRRPDTRKLLDSGLDVVLVIDVQGAAQVRRREPDAISVFILPPSFASLERRLRGRSKDPDEAIVRRLAAAREEIARYREYDYLVVNDDVATCVDRLRCIVIAERSRRAGMAPEAERIERTFEVSR